MLRERQREREIVPETKGTTSETDDTRGLGRGLGRGTERCCCGGVGGGDGVVVNVDAGEDVGRGGKTCSRFEINVSITLFRFPASLCAHVCVCKHLIEEKSVKCYVHCSRKHHRISSTTCGRWCFDQTCTPTNRQCISMHHILFSMGRYSFAESKNCLQSVATGL